MTIDRRAFVLGTAATAVLASARRMGWAGEPASEKGKTPLERASLRFSSQLRLIPGRRLGDQLALLKQWGFEGVEVRGEVQGNETAVAKAIGDAGLVPSVICWGSGGGHLVGETAQRRRKGAELLKRILDSAGQLKAAGVVYVPTFLTQTKLDNHEIRKVLVDSLGKLGEYAAARNTRILLEPLNRKETVFLHRVADAAAICREVGSPGVGLMGDFYHMAIEEKSDFEALVAGGPYLHHVHLASRTRFLPGQDDRSFVEGFRALRHVGFADFCSFECSVKGDARAEIPKSMAFLRQQWDESGGSAFGGVAGSARQAAGVG